MKPTKIAVLLVFGLMGAVGPTARAAEPASPVAAVRQPDKNIQVLYDKMMAALETNDFANFAKPLDDDMKRFLTKKVFDSVIVQMESRFNKGYTAEYFGDVKKNGQMVYIWKLTFKDGGDDVLVQMGLKDGKISEFLLA